jgi:hypothetical protein
MYDLKGSLVNLDVNLDHESSQISERNRQSIIPTTLKSQYKGATEQLMKKFSVLKDVNFLESLDLFIELSPDVREELMETMKQDLDMLKKLNIMDYSLFICLNDTSSNRRFTESFTES